MRRVALIAVLWFAALLSAGAAVGATLNGPEPYEMVRSLEALQDQIVLGNSAAAAAQPKLMKVLALALATAPAQEWKDSKNVRATLIYLFSGGQPQVVKDILARDQIPQGDQKLIKGALAYNEGRQSDAKEFLSDIDARSLAVSIGGYVAFAQSKLVPDDRQKAMEFLDVARLLAPGTLIEEAALRREVFLAHDTGDNEKFLFLSRQYVQRFQKSLYAADFLRRFASAIVQLNLSADPEMATSLNDLFKEFSTNERRAISLMIARAAVVAGNVAAVRFAVDRAEHVTTPGSVEREQTRLYDAAVLILSKDYELGLALLHEIRGVRLPEPDAQLDEAISAVAQQIGKWSDAASPRDGPVAPDVAREKPSDLPVIILAQKALADADQIMQERTP